MCCPYVCDKAVPAPEGNPGHWVKGQLVCPVCLSTNIREYLPKQYR